MIQVTAPMRVLLATEAVDFRKGIDDLEIGRASCRERV